MRFIVGINKNKAGATDGSLFNVFEGIAEDPEQLIPQSIISVYLRPEKFEVWKLAPFTHYFVVDVHNGSLLWCVAMTNRVFDPETPYFAISDWQKDLKWQVVASTEDPRDLLHIIDPVEWPRDGLPKLK